MTPAVVLNIIDHARRQEARSGEFLRQMQERAASLPASITVDGYQPATCLFQFAVEYIEMAPRLIECVDACAREADCTTLFAPFIEAATFYFTQPSMILARYEGLDGLLNRAYMCHRLMEEMCENNRSIRTAQLVDVEATLANLLIHQLIGEPFSNELDEAVSRSVMQIAGSPDYYELDLNPFVQQAKHAAWGWMRNYWENLLVRNHIYFTLNTRL
ncbi:hypothetical protein [Marinobacter zhejiangensis]|uniref:Uncharacterized protein n=1 Tax=Marinobacter zhejiangensis TaxID=488535 RepID=A0A1I4LT81_9GAMM|nr:hypothetical protein [Marinobacter zhejiangensis]SFL94242.1 hypothetical protein SAMN04487963_0649 [Marinobacter zhejiangensis]